MEYSIIDTITTVAFNSLQFFNIILSTILVLFSVRLFFHLRKILEKPEKYAFVLIILHVLITLLGFFVTGIEGTWSRGTIDLDSMDNYKLVSQLIISLLLVMNGTFQFIITKATLQKCRCGI